MLLTSQYTELAH